MKFKYKLFLSLLLFSVISCDNDKFFELERPPEFPWQNVAEFERAAIGAYNAIFVAEDWNNPIGCDVVMDFTISDLSRFVIGSVHGFPDAIINERRFGVANSKVDPAWINCYRAIGVANSAIELIEKNGGNPFPNATLDDFNNNVKRIHGELRFLRAYAYFFLVRYYHPPYVKGQDNSFKAIPFREKMAGSMEECLNPGEATTQEIYDFIVRELIQAKELLPEGYTSAMNQAYKYGRANKYVASAYLMRVYLMMGNFQDAKKECDYIIDQSNGKYDLEKDLLPTFSRSWDNYQEENKEIIWELFAANQLGYTYTPAAFSHFTKCGMFAFDNVGSRGRYLKDANGELILDANGKPQGWNMGGWCQYSMSHDVLINRLNWFDSKFELTDRAKRDKRVNQVYCYMLGYKANVNIDLCEDSLYLSQSWQAGETKPTLWIDKYYRGKEARKHNTPLIRFSEILLTRSIIRFKAGDKQGAADDLNRVRKRAWSSLAGETFEESDWFATVATLTEDDIHNERIAELAGEGFWINYLQAMGLTIKKGDHGGLGNDINPPYSNMYWPMPADEVRFHGTLK